MNRKEILVLSITIFLTVIAWVVSDVLHARDLEHAKFKISVPPTKQYNIDQSILDILNSRSN